MKVDVRSATSVVEHAVQVALPVTACLHILGTFNGNVRAKRSATALKEAGFAVSVLDIESERACVTEEEFRGVTVKHMLVPTSFTATRFKRWVLVRAAWMFLRSTFRLLRMQADVYHALDLPALPACYIAARIRRKPVIFESYELPLCTFPLSELNRSRRLLQRLFEPLLRHIIPRCAGVIAVSTPIQKEIGRRYNRADIALVRNIPPFQNVARTNRLRMELGLADHIRIALYQGYLQSDRNLDMLVRAATHLEPDIVLVIMGKGVGNAIPQLETLIASEGVADRVKILPPAPYNELLQWTASADCGLLIYSPDYSLNVRLCLPNKLFEFLMAGLPVLTSKLEAVAEIIRTYDVGQILPSLSPEDVAAAINTLLSNRVTSRENLFRMHFNALKAARQEFYWEKESQELLRLYENVLAKQKSN